MGLFIPSSHLERTYMGRWPSTTTCVIYTKQRRQSTQAYTDKTIHLTNHQPLPPLLHPSSLSLTQGVRCRSTFSSRSRLANSNCGEPGPNSFSKLSTRKWTGPASKAYLIGLVVWMDGWVVGGLRERCGQSMGRGR